MCPWVCVRMWFSSSLSLPQLLNAPGDRLSRCACSVRVCVCAGVYSQVYACFPHIPLSSSHSCWTPSGTSSYVCVSCVRVCVRVIVRVCISHLPLSLSSWTPFARSSIRTRCACVCVRVYVCVSNTCLSPSAPGDPSRDRLSEPGSLRGCGRGDATRYVSHVVQTRDQGVQPLTTCCVFLFMVHPLKCCTLIECTAPTDRLYSHGVYPTDRLHFHEGSAPTDVYLFDGSAGTDRLHSHDGSTPH